MNAGQDDVSAVGTAVVGTAKVVGGVIPVVYAAGIAYIDGREQAVLQQIVELPAGTSSTVLFPDGSIHVFPGSVADQPGEIVLDVFTVLASLDSIVGSATVGTAQVVGIIGRWPRATLGAVATLNVQANAIANAQIQANAVGNAELQANSVQNAQIAAAAVQNANIASQAIGAGQLLGLSGAGLAAAIADPATQTLLHDLMSSGVQAGIGDVGQMKNAIFSAGATTAAIPGSSTPAVVGSQAPIVLPTGGTWTIFVMFVAPVFDFGFISILNQTGMVTVQIVSGDNTTTGQTTTPTSMMIATAAGGASISFELEFASDNPGVAEAGPGAFFMMAFRSGS